MNAAAYIPSIFNDVLGPVMRGPSSSHSAAALRIGRICRELMDNAPGKVTVSYDAEDALATTHESQGSDMGMKGGLLGFDADDEGLLDPDPYLEEAGIELTFRVCDTGFHLPNLYLVHMQRDELELEVVAISTGGGMIEIIRINKVQVSIRGDRPEELSFLEKGTISPVLPIQTPQNLEVPFSSCEQMIQYNRERKLSAWELAVAYEAMRGGISEQEVYERMLQLYKVMRASIETGLKGTEFKDRIYGAQSVAYQRYSSVQGKEGDRSLHNIIMYVSAIMEVKSSMGLIVAAPTAGSCGTFPGAVMGVADAQGLEEEQIVKALLVGSLTGLFIAISSTFSAEIGGCQAECGSAAGMAAAAIASLMGGSLEQCMAASSMALQNSLGMICDPIAARVEAPCLGKNISSASNALACANMALAAYEQLIPLDEVIETMNRVGQSLPRELRCTALGGLSVTPSAMAIEKKLEQQRENNESS